jgi:hypothetical protein
MTVNGSNGDLLPLPVPADRIQRVILVCIRRMAAHGIRDAHAAQAMLGEFGIHFRRPLTLLRGFMLELAQISRRRIIIAPCCALRMSLDESRIVGILAAAVSDPAFAAHHLRQVTGGSELTGSPMSLAQAFALTLAEAGRPLEL